MSDDEIARLTDALETRDALIAHLRTMPNPFEDADDHGRYWGADTVLADIRTIIDDTNLQ